MIITNQEDTVVGKSSFEVWAATFVVKIKIYPAENGRFSE